MKQLIIAFLLLASASSHLRAAAQSNETTTGLQDADNITSILTTETQNTTQPNETQLNTTSVASTTTTPVGTPVATPSGIIVDVCPAGTLAGSSTITANLGGRAYLANNCGIAASASIVIDASGIPQGVATNRATIQFTNSNVAANAVVLVNIPASNTITSRLIPLTINIKNNAFAALSQLQFGAGGLPPSSIVTIEGNTWEKLQILSRSPTARLLQFSALTMQQNASLYIESNTFAMNDLTNSSDIMGISFSTVNMGAYSTVSVSKNSFDLNGFVKKNCFGFSGNGISFTMKNYGSIVVDDNTFKMDNGLAWIFPRVNYEDANTATCRLSIQRNKISTTSGNLHSLAYHQEVRGLRLSALIKDNELSCVSCSGKWEWTKIGAFAYTDLAITNNKVTVTGGVPQITFTVNENEFSNVTISDNILKATDDILTDQSPWLDFGNVFIRQYAKFFVLRNTFDALYMPTRPVIDSATTSSNFAVAKGDTTRVYMCGNDFFGTTPFSNDYVRLYTTPNFGDQLRPEMECANLFLPYNVTYEPMDSHAAQATISAGIAATVLAALLAVVAA
eukprot:GDKJ01041246.1.p1 GENE.GDKJ01041246.1~~GDKJ01041246.1.p1  ORF type:complete len:565 (-),score=56.44 GDKJ01041246.1:224-1918(-)